MRRGPYGRKGHQRPSSLGAVPKASAVDSLLWQIRNLTPGIPWPEREYHFHAKREFRFDICWRAQSIAIEVDGGIWVYGRHNRASGMVKDMHKGNQAVIYGYRVLHFRPEEIVTKDGRIIEDAIKTITELFKTLGFDPGGKKNGEHSRAVAVPGARNQDSSGHGV